MTQESRRAVFLDRDGVLSALVTREGRAVSPRRPQDFRVVAGAEAAVSRLRASGLLVFVATNQPDVARGHLSSCELEEMSAVLAKSLEVDEIAVCPHDDSNGCSCRKPKPGMLLALAEKWGVDLRRSFVVGDSWRDVAAGHRAGCRTILLIGYAGGLCAPDRAVSSLEEAVSVIESELGSSEPREADGVRE